MALTKPSFAQINTTESGLTDPLTVFNKKGTSADQDVGFILNRDGGATANVAILWDETNDRFALVTTTDSGATDANINIASYSDLKVGTISATNVTNDTISFTGGNITGVDTLRIDQDGSGLRMTNVGAFDNDGSDNFRIFATNDLKLAANGENGTAITIDATNQDVAVTNDLTVAGRATVTGNVDAGNVTATYFTGDGSGLTNVGSTAIPENLNATGNILASGAVFNTLTVNGDADFTGTVTAGQFNTAGNILASGGVINTLAVNTTLNAVSINATGLINTIGNVSAVVLNGGELGVTGTSTLQNVNSSGYVNTTGNVSASVGNFGTVNVNNSIDLNGNVDIGDNNFIRIGDGPDLLIYHDGSDTYFDDVGVGSIFLRSGTTYVQNAAGTKTSIATNSGAGQSIYYNNSLKFETTNTGVQITGEASATGNITAGNLVTTGTVTLDRLALMSSQTTVSPLQLTASSLNDGVGALRIDGSQADIFLNPATATHTTVTFAVNDDQKLAFGMDNNTDFYITRRTGGAWYDDTLVIDRDSGEVNLGYGLTVAGDILNGQSDGVGNIGSSSVGFNTVHATATSAQYADLAERYTADQDYEAGTVMIFTDTNSDYEVTESTRSHDRSVAGVISTNPAYLMNSTTEGVALALQGRVPCKVLGPIQRGELVVTSNTPGTAQRLDDSSYLPGVVIGKALGTIEDDSVQTIEVVVGRL